MTTYYGQQEEDKVLEQIFKKVNIKRGYFVDIGAWDGKHLSNTYRFVELGWDGLEVERDFNRFKEMQETLPVYIKKVCMEVNPDGLDHLFIENKVPKELHLLSIDIDTYDYWLWKNLTYTDPWVVVIESNSMPGYYIQPPEKNFPGKKGTSPEALRELAKSKGYIEYLFNGNCIFVRKDIYELL